MPHPSSTPSSATTRECFFWAGWEPDRYYRRIGARATPFFGNGAWVPAWRKDLESPATARTVAGAGGTTLLTRFYKGFGPAVERLEWESLRLFTRQAHEAGLQVFGYLQGQSLFGEFLFNDQPEAADWVARNLDGTRQTWGAAYNRFAPCLGHQGYRAFMEGIIREGLTVVDLDGLHMDNNYAKHCYCDGCKARFRQWLDARGDLEERTGLLKAANVEPPPLHAGVDFQPDPLVLLWIEFGTRQRLDFMQAMRRVVHNAKPGARLTGNPAFMRTWAARLSHSLDPALEGSACDGLCIENGNRPRYRAGTLHTQADKLLLADAGGLRSWITSWAPAADGGYGIPRTPQALWATLAEEFSFHRCALGNNWALRPAGEGGARLLDTEAALWQEFQRATAFFRTLEAKLGPGRRQWGEVALYVDTESLPITPASDTFTLQAAASHLCLERVAFRVIFQRQPVPEEVHTVLLVGQRALCRDELERLNAAMADRDGDVWLVGGCGLYDEWGVSRDATERRHLETLSRIRRFAGPAAPWVAAKGDMGGYFRGDAPAFGPEGETAFAKVVAALQERLAIRLQAPAGVLINVECDAAGRRLIHIRDLREDACEVAGGDVCLGGIDAPLMAHAEAWPAEGVRFAPAPTAPVALPGFTHYACLIEETPR